MPFPLLVPSISACYEDRYKALIFKAYPVDFLHSTILALTERILFQFHFCQCFCYSKTIADLPIRPQNISPTNNQRRAIMKIWQCVTHFFHYQRMNGIPRIFRTWFSPSSGLP